MKQRNTTMDIMMTFLTKIVYLGGSFIISVVLARLLGTEGKGIVTALFVMPNILISLADMGVRQSAAYYIGQKKYTVQEVFSSSLLLWVITSTISVGLLLLYYLSPMSSNYHWLLISVAIVSVPIKILDTYYYGIHQGKQQIESMNARHLIEFMTKLFGVIVFVWMLSTGVFGAAISTVLAMFTVGVYSYLTLKNTVSFKIRYIPKIPQKLFKKGILFAVALFILSMNYRMDILILEQMVPASEVGLYSVGVGLAELILQLPTAIGTVLFASSANSKSDQEASQRAARLLRVSIVFLVIGGSIFALTSQFIVPFIYGQEFQASSQVIDLLLPGILLLVIVQVLHASLSGRGYPLIGMYVFIISAAMNIGLNLSLIPLYGINGAAISSSVSYAFAGSVYAWIYAKKENLSMKDLLIIKREDIILIQKTIKNIKKK